MEDVEPGDAERAVVSFVDDEMKRGAGELFDGDIELQETPCP